VNSLAEIEQQADYIVIDTGAGISPNVLSFTRAADHVLVVTTPEPTAITDAYAVVKVLSRDNGGRRISLLVNQATSQDEGRSVFERIARVARQFLQVEIFDAGWVPDDEHVVLSVRKRTPFVLAYPRCPAAMCVTQLAMRLSAGVRTPTAPGGFFSRMSRWFRKER
jgi:flagellar biosynthesis protein FlhG